MSLREPSLWPVLIYSVPTSLLAVVFFAVTLSRPAGELTAITLLLLAGVIGLNVFLIARALRRRRSR